MLEEPLQVLAKNVERLRPFLFEPFDRVERNETDERADAKWNGGAVGKAQEIVEESIFFVPQRAIASHHLHRRADIDVVLEEFRR